jgi:prevent-host-death family protein
MFSIMEKTIGAYEARRKFGQLIEEAFYKKDSFIVERSGRPMAVIVPIDAYQRWKRLAKERVFLMLEEVWRRTEDIPEEVLEKEIEQALERLRQERIAEKES